MLRDLFNFRYQYDPYTTKSYTDLKDLKPILKSGLMIHYINMSYKELFSELKKNQNYFFIKKALKEKFKKDFDATGILITEEVVLFISKTPKENVAQKLGIEPQLYQMFDYNSKIYTIDLQEINQNPISEEILNLIHEIGVKYINGEFLTESFKTDNDFSQQIKEYFEDSIIDIQDCQFQFDEHDIAIIFIVDSNSRVDKNAFCFEMGFEPSLFTEIRNVNKDFITVALVCSCPRVVFEEFFDKQDFNDSKGANKWLL